MIGALVLAGVQWNAPASCPSEDEVAARVAALTVGADTDDIGLESTVREEGGRFFARAEVRVGGKTFVRELDAARCEVLAEAVALVVAAAADPVASIRALDEPFHPEPLPAPAPVVLEPEPPLLHPTVPVVAAVPDPPSPPPVRDPEPTRVGFGFAIGAEVGALPAATGLASGLITVEHGRFLGEVTGSYVIRRRAALDGAAGATVGQGVAAIRGCGRLGRRRLFPICAGAEVGGLRGEPFGIDDGRTRIEPWFAGLASAGVRGPVGERLRLFARAEVAVAVVRPSFQLRPSGVPPVEIHAAGLVSGRFVAGVEFTFAVTKTESSRE